jgi:hypothetical protein
VQARVLSAPTQREDVEVSLDVLEGLGWAGSGCVGVSCVFRLTCRLVGMRMKTIRSLRAWVRRTRILLLPGGRGWDLNV